MRIALALLFCTLLTTTASAQRLFVGLEGSTPVTRSSDLAGFPSVTWTNHAAFDVSGAAAKPDGTIYVCNGAFTTQIYRFPLSGAPVFQCTAGVDVQGMGYGNGTLYGFSNYASPMGIYSINLTTGAAALVVDLSSSGYRFFALDFNPDDGLLYGYTEYGTPTGLYSIDPTTGATIFITGNIPASNSQGRGLAVGNNVVYLTATRGDDDIPVYAFDLESGVAWVPFTQPYPQYHSTGGAAWVPNPTSEAGDRDLDRGPRIEEVAPNPVRGEVRVAWNLALDGPARLDVINSAGRNVATLSNGAQAAGRHIAAWDGADAKGRPLPSGVYYLRLTTGELVRSRSVLLLR